MRSSKRSGVPQAEFFENDARHEQAFHAFLDFVCEVSDRFSSNRLNEMARFLVEMSKRGAGDNRVQVVRDCADVFCDRPLIVVQHNYETLGVRLYVVERFVADSAGECGIACYHDDVLVTTAQVAPDRHAEGSG